MSKDVCSKQDIQKTRPATSPIRCGVAGTSVTSHARSRAISIPPTRQITSHSERGPPVRRATPPRSSSEVAGRLQGRQKPGDIVMPGGMKVNIKDMES